MTGTSRTGATDPLLEFTEQLAPHLTPEQRLRLAGALEKVGQASLEVAETLSDIQRERERREMHHLHLI